MDIGHARVLGPDMMFFLDPDLVIFFDLDQENLGIQIGSRLSWSVGSGHLRQDPKPLGHMRASTRILLLYVGGCHCSTPLRPVLKGTVNEFMTR